MNTSKSKPVLALAFSLACLLAAPQGQAATEARKLMVNASGACQSALPVFDVNIRKRPKAVVNEGDAPAFVTCTYYGHADNLDEYPTRVTIHVSTNVLQQTSLTCTGVNGAELDTIQASPKTVNLNNPVNTVAMSWTPEDFGSFGNFQSPYFSVSCQLKPDVAIHNAVIDYVQGVGQ